MKAVSFNRLHPEYEHGYTKPKRATFDPRPLQDREVIIDWNKVFTATEGCASVLCFKSTLSSDHQYINNSSTSNIKPLTLQFIVTNSQNFNEFESLAKENRTSDHISEIELLTKGQSSNDLWFDYRKGVITASVSHNVLTKFKKLHPSVISIENLVAKILGYPKKVKTSSLSWGIEHETYARKRYIKQNRRMHKTFSCNESGLILHSENFMLGASVDGVVTCACCGIGNLEIRCPFSHRDKNIQQYIQQHDSCLEISQTKITLKSSHPYYTQVQHQMYITGASYTDFVIYLPKESSIVREKKDDYFANVSVPLLKKFFYNSIVPEMFHKSIYQKYVCKDVLDDLLYKVVQSTENKTVQDKLNQLTLLSSPPPPPSTGSTVRPAKRNVERCSNTVPPSKKK